MTTAAMALLRTWAVARNMASLITAVALGGTRIAPATAATATARSGEGAIARLIARTVKSEEWLERSQEATHDVVFLTALGARLGQAARHLCDRQLKSERTVSRSSLRLLG